MGSALGPLGQCGALVQLSDCKGRLLAAWPGLALHFVSSSAAPGDLACLWVLAAAAAGVGSPAASQAESATSGTCRHYLRSCSTGGYLSAHDGLLTCNSGPASLKVYMDMDRGVVLYLASKACLQASPCGAALAGRLPLGVRDRPSKVFTLLEAGLPRHSLQAWPLRAALRCQQGSVSGEGGGGSIYMSDMSGSSSGGLSVTSPVACCSEHFLIAPGRAAPLRMQAGYLAASACTLWSADGRRLLSHDPITGRLLLQAQHSCTGRERFLLLLSRTGELQLLAEGEEARALLAAGDSCATSGSLPASPCGSAGIGLEASSCMLAPVVLRHGMLTTAGGGSGAVKPARFALELASGTPTLLLTAHGQLLGCRQPGAGARPCGLTLPPSPAALERCAWLLSHHGDSVYSLTHRVSGCGLYLDDHGAPCLEAPGGNIVYPDERMLFWVEPGWASLEVPAAAGSNTGSSNAVSGSGISASANTIVTERSGGSIGNAAGGSSGAGSEDHGSSTNAARLAAAVEAADAVAPCFVWPSGGGLTAAGFSIRSVRRVGKRHLYLSALPGGLITTVYAINQPTRWELFAPADLQTLLDSPLSLLSQLPCISAAIMSKQPEAAMRRAASMQALRSISGSNGGSGSGSLAQAAADARVGSHAPLSNTPILPAVQEHAPADDPFVEHSPAVCAIPLWQQQLEAVKAPRRCQSDTALSALSELQQQQSGQQRRPLWLAQLLHAPEQQQGWGLTSAASLQQLACRQLCANLAAQYQCQAAGRRLSAGLMDAVEAELSSHLPQEIVSRICLDLRLLLGPPGHSKVSLPQLCKSLAAGEPQAMTSWAQPHLLRGTTLLSGQPAEAVLCTCCRGASGMLLPLDPYINPGHHLFLHAMERTARGGGRVRLRARRRHDEEDLLLRALKAGKLLLLAWAAGRTLGAVMLGS